MLIADIGRMLAIGTVPVAAALGHLSILQLYCVALLVGTFTLLFGVADGAYLPVLLRKEDLLEGNGKLAISTAAAEGIGPGLASVLVQILTAPYALVVDALSFLVSASFLGTIKKKEPGIATAKRTTAFWTEIIGGLSAIIHHPVLRSIAGTSALLNLTGGVTDALLVYYVTVTLGLGPTALGLFFFIGSVSALLGTLLVTRVTRKIDLGPTIVVSSMLMGIGWLAVPLAAGPTSTILLVLAMGALMTGLGNSLFNVAVRSIRQAVTRAELLGRVGSAELLIGYGMLPIGALLGGSIAAAIGAREALLVSMLVRLPLLLALLFSSPLPKFRISEERVNTRAESS
jgi:Na+/melibiose symporter-like transporter